MMTLLVLMSAYSANLIKGGNVVKPPTSADMLAWSKGMAEQVAALDVLVKAYDVEIAACDTRKAQLAANRTKLIGTRQLLSVWSQGAKNWSTVV